MLLSVKPFESVRTCVAAVSHGLLMCASAFSFNPAFASDVADYSFSPVKRYRDSGGGIYKYYPITGVPGRENEKFFSGTYTWSYPGAGGAPVTMSMDVGYLIDCRTTQITQVFSAGHVSPAVLKSLPPDIAFRVRESGLSRLVRVKGLESKNYKRHNVLGQAVTYMDTGAFWLACKYVPSFE